MWMFALTALFAGCATGQSSASPSTTAPASRATISPADFAGTWNGTCRLMGVPTDGTSSITLVVEPDLSSRAHVHGPWNSGSFGFRRGTIQGKALAVKYNRGGGDLETELVLVAGPALQFS